ncbi:hypothetical protein ARALYDRAFT_906644 [Arabidopsis lyrata subsp. lyrata]|uniref:Uncharacterized protein n=1 Tax=Arabidopsis lyrata subsp. lyrata TaxID=81972 RepID=D7LU98_ARALL|nr:hypothetical protein ARALYDRAFT_906644 [Arabidopsis lyrata subsp. lyrata]
MPWWGLLLASFMAVTFTVIVRYITSIANQIDVLSLVHRIGAVNIPVTWYLLRKHLSERLPANSPWTCPSDRVSFNASVIWGLVGPKRIFGRLGNYSVLNWLY